MRAGATWLDGPDRHLWVGGRGGMEQGELVSRLPGKCLVLQVAHCLQLCSSREGMLLGDPYGLTVSAIGALIVTDPE